MLRKFLVCLIDLYLKVKLHVDLHMTNKLLINNFDKFICISFNYQGKIKIRA